MFYNSVLGVSQKYSAGEEPSAVARASQRRKRDRALTAVFGQTAIFYRLILDVLSARFPVVIETSCTAC